MGEISKEAPCSRGSMRGQALKPWMVMCSHGGCWLALFPLCLSLLEHFSSTPQHQQVGAWGGIRLLIHQGPRSSFLSARGSIGAQRNAFCCHFMPDSVCCYDVSGIGSGGCVTMENVCAFHSQIERCVSKSCSLTLQPQPAQFISSILSIEL